MLSESQHFVKDQCKFFAIDQIRIVLYIVGKKLQSSTNTDFVEHAIYVEYTILDTMIFLTTMLSQAVDRFKI